MYRAAGESRQLEIAPAIEHETRALGTRNTGVLVVGLRAVVAHHDHGDRRSGAIGQSVVSAGA
jgi:hypothetical protein